MPLKKEKSKNRKTFLLKKAEDNGTAKESFLSDIQDKERFLRETFERDPWEGFTLVFNHYYSPLCSHAVRYVYSHTYAEDIVSEVFTEFWQKKHFSRMHTSYRAYLFKAVRNRSMNFIRKELGRETKQIDEDLLLTSARSPEQQMVYEQFYQRVQKGIEQLPPKCKKVFLMSRFEGKPLKEIARIQNISVRTAETHISKALRMMREILDLTDEK